MTPSVKVDFNSVNSKGQVKASLRRADASLAEGDEVIAFDPYEHLTYRATVASIDPHRERILLDVAWDEPIRSGGNTIGEIPRGISLGVSGNTIQITGPSWATTPATEMSPAPR